MGYYQEGSMSTKGRNNMGNSSDSDGDQTGNIKQLPLIKGGGSNMNMMNMQHMNNSFHHNSSQISETTYSMKAENQLVGGKKKNSSTFNTSKYMAHSPSPSQTFFKGKSLVVSQESPSPNPSFTALLSRVNMVHQCVDAQDSNTLIVLQRKQLLNTNNNPAYSKPPGCRKNQMPSSPLLIDKNPKNFSVLGGTTFAVLSGSGQFSFLQSTTVMKDAFGSLLWHCGPWWIMGGIDKH